MTSCGLGCGRRVCAGCETSVDTSSTSGHGRIQYGVSLQILLSAGLVRGFPGTGGAEDWRTSGTRRWKELRLQLTCCAPY